MREYKTIETITKIDKLAGIKCDICKKEITGKYWQLTTHHHDWGNDSIDSYKHSDICSRKCINKALDDYIDDCEDSCTQCFELEQDFFLRNQKARKIMLKRICDICGAPLEHGFIYNGGYGHKSGTFKIKIWDDGVVKMDICDRCADKIREICQAEKRGTEE